MPELHPAIQHMADKGYERASLDEMAIVNTMRNSLVQSQNAYAQLMVWLRQENPLNLRGPDLTEWVTEIAEWVLPTQLRRSNATETRKLSEDSISEHQERDSSR
jgi:hypothetical protein